MESSEIKANIFGHSYTIKGDVPPEYIKQISDFVDRKMNEVSASVPNGSTSHIAILVALNIADEYLQLKRNSSGSDSVLDEKTKNLISMLDEGLIGDVFLNEPDEF